MKEGEWRLPPQPRIQNDRLQPTQDPSGFQGFERALDCQALRRRPAYGGRQPHDGASNDTPLGKVYGHGGYFPGYVTWVRWYPERRIAVALQLNTSDNSKIAGEMTDIVNEIASALSTEKQ